VGSYLPEADRERAATGERANRSVVGCFFGLAGVVAGVIVGVWLMLRSYRQMVAESEGGEFDGHGYLLLLFFLPGAVVVGASFGGAIGLLIGQIVTRIGRHPTPLR
jgi:hypothetical protein